MTIENQIHEYIGEVYEDPLKSNIVKATHVRNATEADPTQAGMVLKAMYRGDIEGVELSIYNNPGAGQPRYRIEGVAEDIEGGVYVDRETCVTIRKKLKTGEYTQKSLSEEVDASPTQVSTHGRGHCSHEVDEPPAESVQVGPRRYRYEGVEEVNP